MSDRVAFELVSPERLLMSSPVAMAVVPGSEGDFAVMPGHAPVISTIRHGVLEIHQDEDGAPTRVFLRGGFAEVIDDRLTVLAEEAIMLAELDSEQLRRHIANAEEDLRDAAGDEARAKAAAVLEQLTELGSALGL